MTTEIFITNLSRNVVGSCAWSPALRGKALTQDCHWSQMNPTRIFLCLILVQVGGERNEDMIKELLRGLIIRGLPSEMHKTDPLKSGPYLMNERLQHEK